MGFRLVLITALAISHTIPTISSGLYIPSSLVETTNGDVEGKVYNNTFGLKLNAFLGIPFAQPPTDDRRFKPPVPLQNWTGILSTAEYKPPCIQQLDDKIIGSEDCLYLNVFTPQLPCQDLKTHRPVLFWIQGNGFTNGDASQFNPDLFLREDIIVVTLNYRLGVLGFLNSQDGTVPGNLGLKDIVSALEWVQRNIRNFGGEPLRVTIVGENSGAALVNYLQLVSKNDDLFQYTIQLSGTARAPWAFTYDPQEVFNGLLEYLDLSKRNFLNKVQKMDAADLVNASYHAYSYYNLQSYIDLPFAPSIEVGKKGTLLTQVPMEIYRSASYYPAWTINGIDSLEALKLHKITQKTEFREKVSQLPASILPPVWLHTLENATINQAVKEIKDHYYPHNDVIEEDQLLPLLSDINYNYPSALTTINSSQHNNFTYSYLFDYENNTAEIDAHGTEMGSIVPYLWNPERVIYHPESFLISQRLTRGFANMVKYGNPLPIPDPLFPMEDQWLPSNVSFIEFILFLQFDDNVQMTRAPNAVGSQFWNALWLKYCVPNPICSTFY